MSTTFLTRSGRARALPSRLFFPSSSNILSVPAEMTLQRVLTSTPPRPTRRRRHLGQPQLTPALRLQNLLHSPVTLPIEHVPRSYGQSADEAIC